MKRAIIVCLAFVWLAGCAGLRPYPVADVPERKIQTGSVARDGVGMAEIVFDQPFASAGYHIVGSLESTGFGFTGEQEIRFPPQYRTPGGCKMSIQSTSKLGQVVVNWIAIEIRDGEQPVDVAAPGL